VCLRGSGCLGTQLKGRVEKKLHVLLLLLLLLVVLELLRNLFGLDGWVLGRGGSAVGDHRGHGLRNNWELDLMLSLVLMLLLRVERTIHRVGRDGGHEVVLDGRRRGCCRVHVVLDWVRVHELGNVLVQHGHMEVLVCWEDHRAMKHCFLNGLQGSKGGGNRGSAVECGQRGYIAVWL